jgi:hypothetical protein
MKAAIAATYYCPQCRNVMYTAFPSDSDVPIHWCITEQCSQYHVKYRSPVVELEPAE